VNGGSRPKAAPKKPGTDQSEDFKSSLSHADNLADQVRRRRAASYRLEPLARGVRDPFDRLASPPGPSDFGLCRSELEAEVAQCRKAGWSDWELPLRFSDPKLVAA
jgi:hypothetical protein